MLPARCHHNPDCLPISFLYKETIILLFEAIYRIAHDEISNPKFSHSWLCSLSRRLKYTSEPSPKRVRYNNEGTPKRHRRSTERPLAVTHGHGDNDVYFSPTLIQ